MKKLTALIMATMLLLLAFAGSVSAADNKQPIKVWLGDQEVKFEVPPVIVKGTTYVEFKGLFKALGYSITYDGTSKQITGKSDQSTLTLNTVTGEATVNGEKQKQAAQPLVQKGRTLVPIRFIAEATDMDVKWNSAKQTITITSNGPSDADIKEIQAFLNQVDDYSNADDQDSFMKLIYPGSSLEALVKDLLAAGDDDGVKTKSTSTLTKVLDWQGNTAVIEVEELTEKVSGGFYLDNQSVMHMQLKRGADHQWKLEIIAPQGIQYLNIDKTVSQEADVPADVKAAILSVIDKQIKATNDEDLVAYKATLDPSTPGLDEGLAQVQQTFDAYDVKVTLETARIVEYTESKATVYIVQTNESLKGNEYPNNRASMIATFVKTASGDWVSSDGTVINIEAI
ncbi:copper amine oxidase N-terminal domain-containing protein [Paenibacillus kobensis]|uniref:copper amine oxidase N-terminal domain-containing protein n=1 Tax=Paenibacillus kobensis TaxID=59841 RepID=UPI0013E30F4B|nr:copper amine oxidase N-terminal domain-containing protein [Paenibacillus kobensis]